MNNRERKIYQVTIIGTIVNALLVAIKFIAGVMGRSSALVADAVHSLTDFITDIIVIIFVKISGKPGDEQHGYGHGKFETLATMIIGVILAATGIGLALNSTTLIIDCISGSQLPEPNFWALAVALASIVAKEILYRYTVAKGKQLKSDAVIANAWHHRSDAISSLGTLAGIAGAMALGEKWRILDPIAALVVSIFIIKAGYDIITPALNELLESSLPQQQTAQLQQLITGVSGVKGFHKLRTRKIGSDIAVDVHVKMDGNMRLIEAHDIATTIEREIRAGFGKNTIVNIHMEPAKPTDISPNPATPTTR